MRKIADLRNSSKIANLRNYSKFFYFNEIYIYIYIMLVGKEIIKVQVKEDDLR